MQRSIAIVAGAIFVAAVTTAAASYVYSGNDLLKFCTSAGYETLCFGYINGVGDAMTGGRPIFGNTRACIPKGANAVQLKDIVVPFLRSHAVLRHAVGANLVALALSAAFPCEVKIPNQ